MCLSVSSINFLDVSLGVLISLYPGLLAQGPAWSWGPGMFAADVGDAGGG